MNMKFNKQSKNKSKIGHADGLFLPHDSQETVRELIDSDS